MQNEGCNAGIVAKNGLSDLLDEAEQLIAIFAASLNTAKNR